MPFTSSSWPWDGDQPSPTPTQICWVALVPQWCFQTVGLYHLPCLGRRGSLGQFFWTLLWYWWSLDPRVLWWLVSGRSQAQINENGASVSPCRTSANILNTSLTPSGLITKERTSDKMVDCLIMLVLSTTKHVSILSLIRDTDWPENVHVSI